MCVLVWSDEDRKMAEETVAERVAALREYPKVRADLRGRWKKSVANELAFLQQSFPDSEVLKMDLSDISLEKEAA